MQTGVELKDRQQWDLIGNLLLSLKGENNSNSKTFPGHQYTNRWIIVVPIFWHYATDFNGVVVVQNYLNRTGREEWAILVSHHSLYLLMFLFVWGFDIGKTFLQFDRLLITSYTLLNFLMSLKVSLHCFLPFFYSCKLDIYLLSTPW